MSTNAEYYPTHDRTSCSDTDACNATAEGSTGCARCTAIAMDQADTLVDLINKVHKAKGRYHTQIAMCDLFDAVGLAEELKAMDELTDERILELAHRKATKYTHAVLVTGGPAFTFSKTHIVDFARAIEKEIRG